MQDLTWAVIGSGINLGLFLGGEIFFLAWVGLLECYFPLDFSRKTCISLVFSGENLIFLASWTGFGPFPFGFHWENACYLGFC